MPKKRSATLKRKTAETQIEVKLNLDGKGKARIKTGIAFLDHMLTLFSRHGLFDLYLQAKGDLGVDIHHTNEDIGIVLGQAFKKALKNKKGIRRFGFAAVPMDEVCASVTLDLSGRPSLYIRPAQLVTAKAKVKANYSPWDMKQFLKAFVLHSGTNLHISVEAASADTHHLLEAIFKALGRALDEATACDSRAKNIPSTKGVID